MNNDATKDVAGEARAISFNAWLSSRKVLSASPALTLREET